MDEYGIKEALQPGPQRDALIAALKVVDAKIEEAMFGYRALEQFVKNGMMPGSERMPDMDVLTLIIANRYAKAMAEWDYGMELPLIFARMAAKDLLNVEERIKPKNLRRIFFELDPVKPRQGRRRCHPEITVHRLRHAGDVVIRQPIVGLPRMDGPVGSRSKSRRGGQQQVCR